MDVRKRLRNFYDNQMISTLIEAILDFYQEAVADGAFTREETDYATAKGELARGLTQTESSVLTETENLYMSMRNYAAKHGFTSGIVFGFAQYLSPSDCERYDFRESITDGLLALPGMARHFEFKEWSAACLKNISNFEKNISAELYEHIISVECAWDQRIYSAALHAFYFGYQAAYCLLERNNPTASIHNIAQMLKVEYDLGLTEPYYRRKIHNNND